MRLTINLGLILNYEFLLSNLVTMSFIVNCFKSTSRSAGYKQTQEILFWGREGKMNFVFVLCHSVLSSLAKCITK